jgi:hypothetical protein
MRKIAKEEWFGGVPAVTANFDKGTMNGSRGQVLVELQKTYKGDQRFKLD